MIGCGSMCELFLGRLEDILSIFEFQQEKSGVGVGQTLVVPKPRSEKRTLVPALTAASQGEPKPRSSCDGRSCRSDVGCQPSSGEPKLGDGGLLVTFGRLQVFRATSAYKIRVESPFQRNPVTQQLQRQDVQDGRENLLRARKNEPLLLC